MTGFPDQVIDAAFGPDALAATHHRATQQRDTTSTGVAATVGVPAATPALPAGYDRCACGDLAGLHDIGVRKGVKVRTACACGSCDCKSYQAEVTQ